MSLPFDGGRLECTERALDWVQHGSRRLFGALPTGHEPLAFELLEEAGDLCLDLGPGSHSELRAHPRLGGPDRPPRRRAPTLGSLPLRL